MNTTMELKTVNIQLPVEDYSFLRSISKKMGWITTAVKSKTKKKSELDLSIEEVRKGNVVSFANAEDAIAYLND